MVLWWFRRTRPEALLSSELRLLLVCLLRYCQFLVMMDWVALEMLLHFSDFLNIVHQNWIPCFTLFLDVFSDDFGICLNDKSLLAKSFIFLRDNSGSSYSVVLFVEAHHLRSQVGLYIFVQLLLEMSRLLLRRHLCRTKPHRSVQLMAWLYLRSSFLLVTSSPLWNLPRLAIWLYFFFRSPQCILTDLLPILQFRLMLLCLWTSRSGADLW
jgi:hypothetical protein